MPDRGSDLQPLCIRTMLQPTELPSQGMVTMLSVQKMMGCTPGKPAWVQSKPGCQMGSFHCPVLLREGEKQTCTLLRGREVKTKIKENHRLLLERRELMRQEQPACGPGLCRGFLRLCWWVQRTSKEQVEHKVAPTLSPPWQSSHSLYHCCWGAGTRYQGITGLQVLVPLVGPQRSMLRVHAHKCFQVVRDGPGNVHGPRGSCLSDRLRRRMAYCCTVGRVNTRGATSWPWPSSDAHSNSGNSANSSQVF